MAEQPSGPTFPVHVDERELAEDLSHASEAGRAAIEPLIQQLKTDGVPAAWLRRCDSEARDGTRLPGCVKIYIRNQPASGERCSSAVPDAAIRHCSCSRLAIGIQAGMEARRLRDRSPEVASAGS